MTTRSKAAFVVAGLVLTACVSPLDREYCDEPTPEAVRASVTGRLSFAGGAEILACSTFPKTFSPDVCALRIDPARIAGLFATERFSAEGPPPGPDTYVARFAKQQGIVIAGVIASIEFEGPRIYYNVARDRVIVLVFTDRCHRLSEVI